MSGAPEDPIREADIRGGGGAKDSTRETTSQAGVGTASLRPLKRILIVGPDIKLTKEILDAYAKIGFLIIGDGKNPVSKDEIRDKITEKGSIDENTIITIYAHGIPKKGGGHRLWLHSPGNETKTVLEELAEISPNRRGDPSKKTPLQIHLLACYSGAAATVTEEREPDYSVLPEGSVFLAHGFHDKENLGRACDNIASSIAKSDDKGVFDQIISDCTLEMQNVSIGMRLPEGKFETIVLRGPRENLGLKDSLVEYFDGQWAQTLRDRIAADDGKLPAGVKKTEIPTREQIAGKVTDNFEEYQRILIFNITLLARTEEEGAQAIGYIRQTGKKPDDFLYDGETLLSIVSSYKWINEKIITALIEEGADVNAKDNHGATPLHRAGLDQVARVLLEKGADVNAKDNYGATPLHRATSDQVARVLIEKRADVNAKNARGAAPLHYFMSLEKLRFFILERADVNVKDNEGKTPLHHYANVESSKTNYPYCLENMQELIAAGAKLDAKDNEGKTPLDIAKAKNNQEFIQILDVTAKDSDGKIFLHKCSNPKAIRALVKIDADVHAKDNQGRTPLHYAKTAEVAIALIEAGADINSKDSDGKTPLDIAREKNNPGSYNFELVELLRVLDVKAKDEDGKIYLHKCYDPKLATALIKAGADVNAVDVFGRTPLFQATPDVAAILLEKGADPNAMDNIGKTPLHYCWSDITALALIKAGADVNAVDVFGKTPLDYAEERGFKDDLLAGIRELEASRSIGGASESKGGAALDSGSVAAVDRAASLAAARAAGNGAETITDISTHNPEASSTLQHLIAERMQSAHSAAAVDQISPSPTPSAVPRGVAAGRSSSPTPEAGAAARKSHNPTPTGHGF